MTVIPIVVALIDFGSIKDLPIVLQVMICIAVYSLLNICIYIFRTIKVHGIKKSSFSDLRESSDRKKEIVMAKLLENNDSKQMMGEKEVF